MNGQCCFCNQAGTGESFASWVKPTFTDYDKLVKGNIVCEGCLFYFQEASAELARVTGKDKPQRMRNYSHFVKAGEWTPLSKGDKQKMQDMLLIPPFPELAAIADSGQKHIVFRAIKNPVGSNAGWVQFEEQSIYVLPSDLRALLGVTEALYAVFSKSEIAEGSYNQHRIIQFGAAQWATLDNQIKRERKGRLFSLALFLAQKRGEGDGKPRGIEGEDSRVTTNLVAGSPERFQKQVSEEHLGTIRGQHQKRSIHKQSSEVHQQSLFEDGE